MQWPTMIRTAHLTTDNPKPEMAPALPAMVTVRQHNAANNPIQLNSSATTSTIDSVTIYRLLEDAQSRLQRE